MFFMRNILNKTITTKGLTVLQNSLILRRYKDIYFENIPDVSPTLIKRVLKANNVTYEEGFTCFLLACPVCQKCTKRPASNKAYINKTTGLFLCPTCKSNANWPVLEEYLDEKKRKNLKQLNFIVENNKIREYLRKVDKSTNEVKDLNVESQANILKNFNLPILGTQVLEAVGVRIDDTYDNLYFPLKSPNYEVVGYKILNKLNIGTIQPTLTCSGILIAKSTKSKDSAVIVPNISDLLILLDANVSMNIICLPNGITNLPQYILPCFESFTELILWLGNDAQSWTNARCFAKKLNEKRCLFVRPMEQQQLPHVRPNQDFKSILSSVQPIWHKSITTFVSLRDDVLSDLQNIDKVQGIKWKRYPTLSKILKGHRTGELTVITGPTGSGKTTFISEYSLDLAMQGVNTLWGSFEIRNARLARTMLQQMAGIPLDENLDKFDFWADRFEKLPIYFMTFHGQQTIKLVMEAIEHATYVHDISHVIIDNVQFMMGTTHDAKHMDRFWKQDVIIGQFRNFATRTNCHVTLVIHPRKERDAEDLTTSSIFGGAKASQEADNVLIIQDKRLTSVRGKKFLQIVKNRYSGDLGIMALDFDKASLSYAQKKKKTLEEKINDPVGDHKT